MSRNCISFFVIFLLSASIKADWDDWMWPSDVEETTVKQESTTKTWDEQGICEHDALTIVILKFILETQKQIKNGTIDTGLPPLEPFYIPKMGFELAGTKHNYNVNANISDIHVAGLSNFEVTGITTDMLSMSANISLYLDKLLVSGKYHFKGIARMIVPLPVYAKGRVAIETKNVKTSAHVQIGFSNEGNLVVEQFDFTLDMSQVSVEFKGFTGAMISRRWNEIINSMGLKMFKKMEPKMHDKIRERSILGINKALKDMKYDWQMWQDVLQQMLSCYFG